MKEPRDYGTEELKQRRGRIINNEITRTEYQICLDYLSLKRQITQEQFQAGDTLFWSYVYSGLSPKYSKMYGGKGSGESDKDYELVYFEAIMSVDPYERDIVKKVCCHEGWIKQPREIKLLRRGLDDLYKHWEKYYSKLYWYSQNDLCYNASKA